MNGATRPIVRRAAIVSAFTLGAWFIAASAPLTAQVSKSQTGPCEFTFTIPIEIYGPRATAENAADWKKQIEEVWNGPTESIALKIFEDSPLHKVNPELYRKPSYMRETIRRSYHEMFGDGMQINCCTIKFVADIRVRTEDAEPTEGYNQVHAVPAHFGEWDALGKIPLLGDYIGEYQIEWFRSYVRHLPDSPDDLPGGEWAHEPDYPVYAHEVGHLLGINDYYEDKVDENGHTHGEALPGHENDLMGGDMQGFLKDEHLNQILEFHNVSCNCCPRDGLDALLQSFAVTSRAAGDAILAHNCAVLRQTLNDLKDQRRNAQLTPLPILEKYDFLKRLDEKIDAVRKAWLACTPEPGEAVTTGNFGDYGLSSDATTFCTYDNGLPTPIGVGPPPGGQTPGQTPGSTPGSTPQPDGGIQWPPWGGYEPGTTPPPRPGLEPPRPGLTPTVIPGPQGGEETTDQPQNAPPTDDEEPRDVPVTVHIKAKKSVLHETGVPLASESSVAGRRLKLIVPELQDPALPLVGNDKDITSGAADDPLQCTTDEDGECDIERVVVTGSRINRIDIEVPVQDVRGGVIPVDSAGEADIPEGGEVTGRLTLGGKDYLRLRWDAGIDLDYRLKLDMRYDWHEDLCKDEQPGPWLGTDPVRFAESAEAVPRQRLLRHSLWPTATPSFGD